MPLLLIIPLLVAGLFVLWVLLLPISIVQRYRYRRKSYSKHEGKWVPADLAKESADYEERVEQEAEQPKPSNRRRGQGNLPEAPK